MWGEVTGDARLDDSKRVVALLRFRIEFLVNEPDVLAHRVR
jgi:hypothetical protein